MTLVVKRRKTASVPPAPKPGVKRIVQFGYTKGAPEGIPLVDCRTIANPYRLPEGEKLLAVRNDPEFAPKVEIAVQLLTREKADVIGIGCSYGIHRSGAVAQEVVTVMAGRGIDVEVVNQFERGGFQRLEKP